MNRHVSDPYAYSGCLLIIIGHLIMAIVAFGIYSIFC